MTTHNGKKITQRGGMDGEYGKVYNPTPRIARGFQQFAATKDDWRTMQEAQQNIDAYRQSRDSSSADHSVMDMWTEGAIRTARNNRPSK
jgi:hypothetical protein